jgi:hypothetical protein
VGYTRHLLPPRIERDEGRQRPLPLWLEGRLDWSQPAREVHRILDTRADVPPSGVAIVAPSYGFFWGARALRTRARAPPRLQHPQQLPHVGTADEDERFWIVVGFETRDPARLVRKRGTREHARLWVLRRLARRHAGGWSCRSLGGPRAQGRLARPPRRPWALQRISGRPQPLVGRHIRCFIRALRAAEGDLHPC